MLVYWRVIQQTRFGLFALLSFDFSIPNLPPKKTQKSLEAVATIFQKVLLPFE